MRTKSIIIVSRLLCLVLLFRICFLSLNPVCPSIVSTHSDISIVNEILYDNYTIKKDFKENVKHFANNINLLLHFFKNRIAGHKKLVLSLLFFIESVIFLKTSIYASNEINLLISKILDFLSLRKYIALSILRI